jgi:hypothetical protein
MGPSWDANSCSATQNKWVQRHCTYSVTYDRPWLYYFRNGIVCSSVDHFWLLNTEQQWNPYDPVSTKKRHFAFGPLSVHTAIFLKIQSMQFYVGWWSRRIPEIESKSLQPFSRNCHFWGDPSERLLFWDLKRAHSPGTDIWRITPKSRIWINSVQPYTYIQTHKRHLKNTS